MIYEASERSGLTNKTGNEKDVSNDRHNKNNNGCRPDKRGERYIIAKIKGKVEVILTLGVK